MYDNARTADLLDVVRGGRTEQWNRGAKCWILHVMSSCSYFMTRSIPSDLAVSASIRVHGKRTATNAKPCKSCTARESFLSSLPPDHILVTGLRIAGLPPPRRLPTRHHQLVDRLTQRQTLPCQPQTRLPPPQPLRASLPRSWWLGAHP